MALQPLRLRGIGSPRENVPLSNLRRETIQRSGFGVANPNLAAPIVSPADALPAAPPPEVRRGRTTPPAEVVTPPEQPTQAVQAQAQPGQLPQGIAAPAAAPTAPRPASFAPQSGLELATTGLERLRANPPRGVFTDALTPQFSAENTVGRPAQGISTLPFGSTAAAAPQVGQTPATSAFLEAVQAYQSAPSGGGMAGLASRGRQLNALRALAGQAGAETRAGATLGAAGIGAAEDARRTAVQESLGQLGALTEQQRLGIAQQELELAQAAAQPDFQTQVRDTLLQQYLNEPDADLMTAITLASGEVPQQELVFAQPGSVPVGVQQAGQFNPALDPATMARFIQLGILPDPEAR